MVYRLVADLVLVIHLLFILFATLGSFLVFKYRRLALFHLPAWFWAVLISFGGWVCPLTPLENWLRQRSGAVGYEGSFIEHYLLPIIYPGELTRSIQISLGLLVLAINFSIYGWIVCRSFKT